MLEKKPQKLTFSEFDAATITQRYDATTLLTVLQEVAHYAESKFNWNELVKKTTSGISNAREYQMLWRHLAYRFPLPDNLEDGDEPMDDDSDMDCEMESLPSASAEATSETAACVKVIIASRALSESTPSSSTIEAPLPVTFPVRRSSRTPKGISLPSNLMEQTSIMYPVTVQRQTLPNVSSSDALETKGTVGGTMASKRKRKAWSEEDDNLLRAAVQRWGEGNWATIAKGDHFPVKRTATQLSQRWGTLRKKDGCANSGANPGANSGANPITTVTTNTQYTAEQLATRHSLNLALDMPFKKLSAPGTTDPGRTSTSIKNQVQTQNATQVSTVRSSVPPQAQISTVRSSVPPQTQGSTVRSSVPPQTQGSTVRSSVPPQTQVSTVVRRSVPSQTQVSIVRSSVPPQMQASTVRNSVPPQTQASTVRNSVPPQTQASTVRNSVPPQTQASTVRNSVPPQTQASTVRNSVPPQTQPQTQVSSVRNSVPPGTQVSTVLVRSSVPPQTQVSTVPVRSSVPPQTQVSTVRSSVPPQTQICTARSSVPPQTQVSTARSSAPPQAQVSTVRSSIPAQHPSQQACGSPAKPKLASENPVSKSNAISAPELRPAIVHSGAQTVSRPNAILQLKVAQAKNVVHTVPADSSLTKTPISAGLPSDQKVHSNVPAGSSLTKNTISADQKEHVTSVKEEEKRVSDPGSAPKEVKQEEASTLTTQGKARLDVDKATKSMASEKVMEHKAVSHNSGGYEEQGSVKNSNCIPKKATENENGSLNKESQVPNQDKKASSITGSSNHQNVNEKLVNLPKQGECR